MVTSFYLKSLVIQNFATFRNQTIQFGPGFNAIVGETGSGKSLVLDALELILGGRGDKRVVRRGADYSLIEASFHCEDPEVASYLLQQGFPCDGTEVIVKRLIYKNGATKTYVNHLSCTLGFLGQFSAKFIDLVGQFENQKLLSSSYQLSLLDQFARHRDEVREYQARFVAQKERLREAHTLQKTRSDREQRLDYLNYQLQEIEKLNPSSQDETDLLKRKHTLVNFEKTQRLGTQVRDLFEGSEGGPGINGLVRQLNTLLLKNTDVLADYAGAASEIMDAVASLEERLDRALTQEIDPEELEGVVDRLDLYQRLKKKFGGSVESILQSREEFSLEKLKLEGLEVNLAGIDEAIRTGEEELRKRALALHERRVQVARKLSNELTKKVRALKMTGATISIDLEVSADLVETGLTLVSFRAETNPGEGYHAIKDIASGGELSRILLSVRQILSRSDSISVFLFDEIDTGIGGETANCIGRALEEVGEKSQVIAITHLPQIAQFCDLLIKVQKETDDREKRTESLVRELTGKSLEKEVRTMARLG